MPEIAGRIYVPKLYPISSRRTGVVDFLEQAVVASGGRMVFCSYPAHRVAPIYMGVQDTSGGRYGLLVYPFTTTKRPTPNRPGNEHRTQIRFGDPTKARDESNPIGRDVAGVDVTLVLGVDPELGFIVGLDPMIYADLPMGISVYYQSKDIQDAGTNGWAVWEREKTGGTRRPSWEGLEAVVGFRPHRFLDYVRFEAKASALGLAPGLRRRLADTFADQSTKPHPLEEVFGLASKEILDIIDSNFRLGIAVRGGVAERHLEGVLRTSSLLKSVTPIDEDGKPDFVVTTKTGKVLTIECKTASSETYAKPDRHIASSSAGDMKVEAQKTRDSGAGRKYTFDQFDILAACVFSITGLWEYRFRWTKDLQPWDEDTNRIKAVQRIGSSWATSLDALLGEA